MTRQCKMADGAGAALPPQTIAIQDIFAVYGFPATVCFEKMTRRHGGSFPAGGLRERRCEAAGGTERRDRNCGLESVLESW